MRGRGFFCSLAHKKEIDEHIDYIYRDVGYGMDYDRALSQLQEQYPDCKGYIAAMFKERLFQYKHD